MLDTNKNTENFLVSLDVSKTPQPQRKAKRRPGAAWPPPFVAFIVEANASDIILIH